MCVWNIWTDVKLLPDDVDFCCSFGFLFFSDFSLHDALSTSTAVSMSISTLEQGGQPREHSWLPNEEGYATTDMESDQLHVPASFLCYGKWPTQEPPCRFQTTCVQFSWFARFSQSEFPLSVEDDWAASERFEWFPSHSFSLLIIRCLLSGLTEVFLHVRCIPHQ